MKRLNLCLCACLVSMFTGCEKNSSEEVTGLQEVEPVVELISPAEASTLLKENPDARVLDIRTPEEFAEGYIEGAIHIDYMADGFDEEVSKLDRTVPYVMHCASGGRSGKSLSKFEALGFEKIYHLKAGFDGWEAKGLPVIR